MHSFNVVPSSALHVPALAVEVLSLDADAGRAARADRVVSLACDTALIHERVSLDGVWFDRLQVGDAALVTWARRS